MAIEFRTSEYEMSHGHKPRGTGYWAFEFVSIPGEVGGNRWRVEFAPINPTSLGEAKKWARNRAKELNTDIVKVCS